MYDKIIKDFKEKILKIGKIEEIYKPTYYASNEQISHVIRIKVELKQDVNEEKLKKAISIGINRYPYFKVRAQIDGNAYVNVENDLPVIVNKGIRQVHLLTKESNYYPFIFQYEDKVIVLDISHSITDGRGIMPLFNTVIYYYIKYTSNENISSNGINLFDSPLFDDELGDPRDKVDFTKIEKPLSTSKNTSDFFRIKDINIKNVGNKVIHYISVDENEFMKFSKSSDGSPAVVVAALFSKVLWKISNTNKDLFYNIACDHRPMLGNIHSYRSLSNVVPIIYKKSQKDWDIDRLCTVSRGSIILQTDPQNILYNEKMSILRFEKMNQIPTLEMLKSLLKDVLEKSLDSCTTSISYPGKLSMQAFEPYVNNLFMMTDDVPVGGFCIEIMAYNHNFEIALIQGFDDDCLINGFMNILKEKNIPFNYLNKEPLKLAKAIPEI